jgi:hypothetical protein
MKAEDWQKLSATLHAFQNSLRAATTADRNERHQADSEESK